MGGTSSWLLSGSRIFSMGGGDLQIRLGLEVMAHGGEWRRMLQVQTPKLLITQSPPNTMAIRVSRASIQTLMSFESFVPRMLSDVRLVRLVGVECGGG